jgi:hypothetical protein
VRSLVDVLSVVGGNMGNKEKNKVYFDRKCFEEALKLRNSSIRKLGAVTGGVKWSEKTIRRALIDGQISPELLDDIAQHLDVDPEYLSGKYHRNAEKYKDPYIQASALYNLKAERYPYLLKQQREKIDDHFLYDRYLENILIIHNLSLKQFNNLTFEIRKKIQLELEESICRVLIKYFDKDAFGKELYPEIYRLQNDIDNYDPDFQEPPPEFFEEMMRDRNDRFTEKYKILSEKRQ